MEGEVKELRFWTFRLYFYFGCRTLSTVYWVCHCLEFKSQKNNLCLTHCYSWGSLSLNRNGGHQSTIKLKILI